MQKEHELKKNKDVNQSLSRIRFYAAEGNAAAQRELGLRFLEGNDVSKNPEEAVRWFRQAARQGDDESIFQLGRCYAEGIGIEKDSETAKKYLRRAAAHGHSEAARLLGARYQAVRPWFGLLFAVFAGIIGLYLAGGEPGGFICGVAVGGFGAYFLIR